MPQPQGGPGEGWNGSEPFPAQDSVPHGSAGEDPFTELEPGWRAIRALMQIRSDGLLAVMLRPSFRPVRDLDLVAVSPCGHCRDGGMRTAGSVRVRKGRVTVRACDTCGAVDVGDQALNARNTQHEPHPPR